MEINLLGIRIDVYKSKHEKFQFIKSRLMNAWQFWILPKSFTLHILIPAPSLFYQVWNKEKGWTEDFPTRYERFWIKLRELKRRINNGRV